MKKTFLNNLTTTIMKLSNLLKGITLVAFAIAFTACSNDNDSEIATSQIPLKSYTLSRDADGSYTLEHNVANGITSSLNSANGVNDILLLDGNSASSYNSVQIPLVNNEIKVNFLSNALYKIPGLTIIDEPIVLRKGTSNKKDDSFLESYSITQNENGNYTLDFTVDDNVVASFSYNEEFARHEIRLEPGDDNGVTTYSQNYTKLADEALIIAFKHIRNTSTGSKLIRLDKPVGPPVLILD